MGNKNNREKKTLEDRTSIGCCFGVKDRLQKTRTIFDTDEQFIIKLLNFWDKHEKLRGEIKDVEENTDN